MEKEISTLDLVINRLKGHLPEYHYEVLQKEWQTLKSAVLSQPAHNISVMPCCEICGSTNVVTVVCDKCRHASKL